MEYSKPIWYNTYEIAFKLAGLQLDIQNQFDTMRLLICKLSRQLQLDIQNQFDTI